MKINHYIEHTLLKPTVTLQEITALCNESKAYEFPVVCVPPMFIKHSKSILKDSNIKIATVIGFPFGYCAIEAKVAEIVLAIIDGADELDMVINITSLKNNDWQYLANEISTIMPIIISKNKIIKVIIESGILTDDEIIKCCDIYGMSGVDYIKTSTGYAERGASVEAIKLIRAHTEQNIKIKASGGIKTLEFASQLIQAGADRLGCSNSVNIVKEQQHVL